MSTATRRSRPVTAIVLITAALLAGLLSASPARAQGALPNSGGLDLGLYTPLTPARILDTRAGIGGPAGPLGQRETIDLNVLGAGGVPVPNNSIGFKITAVALNVTVTEPTAASFLTAYPGGENRPNASNLNFTPGQTVPNLVIVKVGDNGRVNLYNDQGSTHVVADVVGYYSLSLTEITGDLGSHVGLPPARVLDTRTAIGGHLGALVPRESFSLRVTGRGGVPQNNVSAVILNVTVTEPTATGFVTVYPTGQPRPTASNLNFTPGLTAPNLVIARVGTNGSVDIYNSGGNTHVVADVMGYYSTDDWAGQQYGLSPARLMDTRNGNGGKLGKIGPQQQHVLQIAGRGGVPATGADSVILNVTVTEPTATGFLTVYPTGEARPTASNLNFTQGTTRPNLVIAKLGDSGRVSVFNGGGNSHVIVDVLGWYSGANSNPFHNRQPVLFDATAGPLPRAGDAPPASDLYTSAGPDPTLTVADTHTPEMVEALRAGQEALARDADAGLGLGPASVISEGNDDPFTSPAIGALYTIAERASDGAQFVVGSCTGVVIDRELILTAYHCTENPNPAVFSSVVGFDFVPTPFNGVPASRGFYTTFGDADADWVWNTGVTNPAFVVPNLGIYPPYDFAVIKMTLGALELSSPFNPIPGSTAPGADLGTFPVLLDSPGGPKYSLGILYGDDNLPPFGHLEVLGQQYCNATVEDYLAFPSPVTTDNPQDFLWQNDCFVIGGNSGGPSFELYRDRWAVAGVITLGDGTSTYGPNFEREPNGVDIPGLVAFANSL